VLARARRAQQPGVVFARDAAIGEVDLRVDVDSRLFVGLSSERRANYPQYHSAQEDRDSVCAPQHIQGCACNRLKPTLQHEQSTGTGAYDMMGCRNPHVNPFFGML
jgi:hypothetical protein